MYFNLFSASFSIGTRIELITINKSKNENKFAIRLLFVSGNRYKHKYIIAYLNQYFISLPAK